MSIQVFIHLGPPKTATSAIQNWMQQNRDELIQQGIFYPEHGLDENGVSSGNVLNIFDRAPDKSLTICQDKVKNVLLECEQNKCSILLMSSEFFFFQVEDILSLLPNAKLIVYIRFPLEVIESSYNQAVKRHNQTKPLGLPKEPQAYHLVLLEKMLKSLGSDSFITRFYSQEAFVGGNIVSDLLSVIGADNKMVNSTKVNSSYSFEALEFKRWLNCFLPPEYQHRVDQLLQSYQSGTESYSLIKPADYQYYTQWFCSKLNDFFEQYPVEGSEEFVGSIGSKQQKTYIKQSMTLEQFTQVANYLIEADIGLTQILVKEAAKSELAIEKRADFYDALRKSVPTAYKVKTRLREWRFMMSRKIKRAVLRLSQKQPDLLKVRVSDLIRMRTILKIDDDVTDGEIYRELALYCEQNGELHLAYRLMVRANELRPNGSVILAKIAEYQDRLNVVEGDS